MQITPENLEKFKFKPIDGEWIMMLGTVKLLIRINADRAYCELDKIYVGSMSDMHQLNCLVFGLTGRDLSCL
jgi:hypothetical protein